MANRHHEHNVFSHGKQDAPLSSPTKQELPEFERHLTAFSRPSASLGISRERLQLGRKLGKPLLGSQRRAFCDPISRSHSIETPPDASLRRAAESRRCPPVSLPNIGNHIIQWRHPARFDVGQAPLKILGNLLAFDERIQRRPQYFVHGRELAARDLGVDQLQKVRR
jgi:hypothetical protein